MKKQLIKKGVLLAFVLLTIQSLYAQEQNSSRFDITLYSIVNKQKNTLKLESFGYTIDKYRLGIDGTASDNSDLVYVFVSGSESLNKEFVKIFETKNQNIDGYIEIIDTLGKAPIKKIEFKNAKYSLSENYSSVFSGSSSFSATISVGFLIIDWSFYIFKVRPLSCLIVRCTAVNSSFC